MDIHKEDVSHQYRELIALDLKYIVRDNIVMNEKYFSRIDTEEKAYWLGFLTADGNIHTKSNRYSISLGLARKDREHLVSFKNALNATTSVRDYLSNNYPCAGFAIYSKEMVQDLARLGIGPRKSMICKPAKMPKHLKRHYWRGLVDGDGCISGKEGKTCIELCGNKHIVDGFRFFIAKTLKQTPVNRFVDRNIWRVRYQGSRLSVSVAKILYDYATVYLERKMILAKQCMAIIPKNRSLDHINSALLAKLYRQHGKWKIVAEILNIDQRNIPRLRKTHDIDENGTRRTIVLRVEQFHEPQRIARVAVGLARPGSRRR